MLTQFGRNWYIHVYLICSCIKLVRTQLAVNNLHLGYCITIFYPLAISAVCKDEEGSVFLIKDENGLPLSDCMNCHCEASFLTCRRTLNINFPGYYHGLYVQNENCVQPQCNVTKFVRKYRDYCEGNKSPPLNLLIILLYIIIILLQSVRTDYKVNNISIYNDQEPVNFYLAPSKGPLMTYNLNILKKQETNKPNKRKEK